MVKILDRVWQQTATTGTGTLTLGAALPGFLTAAEAGGVDTDEVEFVIRDGDDFELSRGVLGSSATTLTRATVIRSKIGGTVGTSKINLSGAAEVFVVSASARLPVGTGANTLAAGDDSRITGAVQTSRQVATSTGLTGGGNLSADRTLSVDKATDANVRSAASNKVLTADLLESAAAEVSVAETGSSPTLSLANFDWDLFINGAVTLSASRTLSNPATSQIGTWRRLIVTQNGTGGYTLSFGNQYRFPGGIVPVVASAANAVTTLDIYCRSASLFDVYAAIGMAS